MIFIVLSGLAGLALMVATVYTCKRFRSEWQMPRGLYLKAGMALLALEFFHFAMMDGVIAMWPEFMNMNLLLQAGILGIGAGIFFEFGRFMFLDKFFRGVRLEKEGLYFALGWNGVATFLIGLLVFLGTVGLYVLVNTDDLSSFFNTDDEKEMEQVVQMQEEAQTMIKDYPLLGFSPIIERGSILVLDMALTLLILLYFMGSSSVVVWQAAGIRAVATAGIFAAQRVDLYLGALMYIVVGLISFLILRKVRAHFDGSYSLKINGT